MFRGKKYKDSAKQIDRGTLYDPKEGLELVCKTASAKFDETVELHVKLGVDSRHADQQVRGAIVLPNGTGKTARVLVTGIAERPFNQQPERILPAEFSNGFQLLVFFLVHAKHHRADHIRK